MQKIVALVLRRALTVTTRKCSDVSYTCAGSDQDSVPLNTVHVPEGAVANPVPVHYLPSWKATQIPTCALLEQPLRTAADTLAELMDWPRMGLSCCEPLSSGIVWDCETCCCLHAGANRNPRRGFRVVPLGQRHMWLEANQASEIRATSGYEQDELQATGHATQSGWVGEQHTPERLEQLPVNDAWIGRQGLADNTSLACRQYAGAHCTNVHECLMAMGA